MKIKISGFVCALAISGIAFLLGTTPTRGQQAEAPAESSAEALRVYEGARNAQINNAFDVAVDEWSRFLKDFPEDPLMPRVLYNLGVCRVQQKQWDKAIAAFSRVVAEFPKAEDLENVYLNLGWSQYSLAQTGKPELYAEAVKSFTILLDKFPKAAQSDEALFFLGESHYLQGNKKEAIEAYRRLVDEHPDSKLHCDAMYALGVAHEELEQYADAGAVYDQFLQTCEQHRLATEVTMRKAETLLQTGSVEDAEQLFGEVAAVADFASADHARFRQAFCLSRLEKYQEAAESYATLGQDFPKSQYVADAEIAAAREYYRARDFEDAIKWFEAARKRGGEKAFEATHWLCKIHLSRKQSADAERLAEEVIPQASGSTYLVDLLLDHADAVYDQPARDKRAALKSYLEIAKNHADHRLAPQALYNAAFATFELKLYDDGLKLAKQLLEKYPDDSLVPDAQYLAAECAIQQREYAGAQAQLKKLIETHPERADVDTWRLRLGMAMELSGDHEGTIKYLESLLKQLKDPDRVAEAQFMIGVCKFSQNDFAAAAENFEASLKSSSTWRQAGEAAVYLARCRQKQGKLEEARALINDLVSKSSGDAAADQIYYRAGELNYAAADYKAAREAYAKTIADHPQSSFVPYALYGKGWSEIKLQDFPAAIASFAALLEGYSTHELADDARLALAMAKRQSGQFDVAIVDFNQYLATNPPQPQKSDALYERGLAEAALRQFDKAVTTLTSLLDENPQYASADKVRYELAWAYRGLEQSDKALDEFKQLAKDYPKSPLAAEAAFHVGEDLYQHEKYDEAMSFYTTAKEVAQDSELKEKAVYKLAWSLFQKKDYESAIKSFEEQASNFPNSPLNGDALFMQGECLFKLERYEPALELLMNSGGHAPSSEQMQTLGLLHGAQAASQLKKWEQSIDMLNTLIEKFEKSPYLSEAFYERGWAQQKKGNLDEAWADFEKAAEDTHALGARARFMMGELRFGQKQYDDAIREFKRTMYLYGGDDAPEDVKVWQAKAAFDAGRCTEVQIEAASSAQVRAAAIAEAKKFYSFIIQKHPQNGLATEAKKRLEALAKL